MSQQISLLKVEAGRKVGAQWASWWPHQCEGHNASGSSSPQKDQLVDCHFCLALSDVRGISEGIFWHIFVCRSGDAGKLQEGFPILMTLNIDYKTGLLQIEDFRFPRYYKFHIGNGHIWTQLPWWVQVCKNNIQLCSTHPAWPCAPWCECGQSSRSARPEFARAGLTETSVADVCDGRYSYGLNLKTILKSLKMV